jgi:TolB-like protein
MLEYLAEAAKGLDYLHEPRHPSGDGPPRGIQHRDIKPQNLLLSGGSVKVGDFGLARCLEHSLTSHTGGMTAAYAAPEFFRGQTSSQSDQYSLAVTYCRLRGGRLPFEGNAAELMAGHLSREPDLSMLPPEERPAVARALAKEPGGRWPSCGELVNALRQAQPALAPAGWTSSNSPQPQPRTRRARRWLIGAVAGFLVLVLGVLVVWSKLGHWGTPTEGDAPLPLAPPPQAEVAPGTVTLAVLDFENHTKDPALEGFRQGLRDMLVTDLARVSKVKVVERSRLNAILAEHKLAQGGFIDPRTAVRLGKGLAAKSLLTGSYVISGDEVRVDVRLISVESGEIELADKVTGTKAKFFRLQQALAEKVLAGLKLQPTAQERQVLGQPQTKDFEAFRLYSEAMLAQRQGRRKEAEASLRQAVARDPQFGLARRELAAVEAAALTRLAEGEKDRLARAGKVGKALEENLARHQAVVAKAQHDAPYFAGLIVLSSHAGLLGDPVRERKLLLHYWKEFSEHVAPEKALALGVEVQNLVAPEGKFFQEQVDSGDYSTFLAGLSTPEQYFKPELRGALRWPTYAAIWPFDFDLREAFRVVRDNQDLGVQPAYFEKQLPRHPHDYLRKLLESPKSKPGDPHFIEVVRLQQSVIRYYARLKDRPADLAQGLVALQKGYLSLLDRRGPETWGQDFLLEVVPVLELLATSEGDAALKEEANRLLFQYVRQARLNAGDRGEPAVAAQSRVPAPEVTFCSLKLAGPRVVFVCDTGELLNFRRSFVQKELTNAVRALSPTARLNVHLFGRLRREAKSAAFNEVRPADVEAQRTASAFIRGMERSGQFAGVDAQKIDLGTALVSALADWPTGEAGEGDLCVVSYGRHPKITPGLLEQFKKREAGRPRIHFVGEHPVPALGELVRHSGGSAVLLEEGDLLQTIPRRWTPPK